jgi:hypothetical protein
MKAVAPPPKTITEPSTARVRFDYGNEIPFWSFS